MKIGIVSVTLNAVNPVVRFLQSSHEVEFLNYLDSGLIEQVNREGTISEASMDRMKSMLKNARADNVDGILLTCTAFSPYADALSDEFGIPVIPPDSAMIEQALDSGKRTAILYTFPSTRQSTQNFISSIESRREKKLDYDLVFIEGAFDELQKGNHSLHDRLIMDRIMETGDEYGLILLAQISMAGAADNYAGKIPVITSPSSALEELKGRLKEKGLIMMKRLLLGCIADDFTGASDLASFLSNAGVSTLLFNGIPEKEEIPDSAEAIVIALKTRTIEKLEAVSESLAALEWLKRNDAERIYIKYCSTFDSTREGNIGPVVDSVIESLGVPYTIICPSLPANGRTVKDGNLYVYGIPLNESPMKDHPLTPMWDSDIRNLMGAQSRYESHILDSNGLNGPKEEILSRVMELGKGQEHFYIIPDFEEPWQGEKIAHAFIDLKVITGGSGLMEPLGKALKAGKSNDVRQLESGTDGAAIVLAGSCSLATLSQIDNFLVCKKGPALKLDPMKITEGKMGPEDIIAFISENQGKDILIYSSEPVEKVRRAQSNGAYEISGKLENLMSMAAEESLARGYGRIIVAGGETSGAVTKRLGFQSYHIGESVAPGVPVMAPVENPEIRLVLKSGNFGDETFFTRAIEMTGGKQNG